MEQKLFTFGYNEKHQRWEILERDFRKVKEKLLAACSPTSGSRSSRWRTATTRTAASCCLRHKHEGVDLKLDYARDTLRNLQSIWRRPVNLASRMEGRGVLFRFDGRDHSDRKYEL